MLSTKSIAKGIIVFITVILFLGSMAIGANVGKGIFCGQIVSQHASSAAPLGWKHPLR